VPPSNFVTGGWSKKWQLYPSPVIILKDGDFNGSRGPKSKQSMVFSSHLWRVLAVKVLFDENLSSGINSFQWGITAGEMPWTACFYIYINIYKTKHMETWHLFNPYCVQEVFPSQHALFRSTWKCMSSWYIYIYIYIDINSLLCPREEEMKKEKHEGGGGEQFLEEKSPNALFFSSTTTTHWH
jgi:hypothetical protein